MNVRDLMSYKFSKLVRALYRVFITAFCVVIVSCGGGDSTENYFSVSFSQKSIYIPAEQSYQTIIIDAEAQGDPGVETIYVTANVSGEAFSGADVHVGSTGGTLLLNPNRSLWSGEYVGDVQINICADEACQRHLASSPYVIPYTVIREARIWRMEPSPNETIKYVSRNHIKLFMEQNSEVTQVEYRLDVPSSLVDFSLPEEMINDFQISNVSRNGFTMTPDNSDSGFSYRLYRIATIDTNGQSRNIEFSVSQTVSPQGIHPDEFRVFIEELNFRVPSGWYSNNSSAHDYIPIYRPYFPISSRLLDFSYQYQSGTDWIRAETTGTQEFPVAIGVEISANQFGLGDLTPGQYSGTLIAEEYDGQTQEVAINMDVYEGFLEYTRYFHFGSDRVLDSLSILVNTTFPKSSSEFYWRIDPIDSWINVNSNTPQNDSHFRVSVDLDYMLSLPNNSEVTGFVQLSHVEGGGREVEPAMQKVVVTKNLAVFEELSDQIIETGSDFVLQIRGVNLSELTRIAISPVGNIDGIDGLLDVNYSLEEGEEEGTLIASFDAVEVEGDFEIFAITSLDYKLNLSEVLTDRLVIRFVEAATIQNKPAIML